MTLAAEQPVLDRLGVDAHLGQVVQVAPCVGAGPHGGLDGVDATVGADQVGGERTRRTAPPRSRGRAGARPAAGRGRRGRPRRARRPRPGAPARSRRPHPPRAPGRVLAHPAAPTQPGHGHVGGQPAGGLACRRVDEQGALARRGRDHLDAVRPVPPATRRSDGVDRVGRQRAARDRPRPRASGAAGSRAARRARRRSARACANPDRRGRPGTASTWTASARGAPAISSQPAEAGQLLAQHGCLQLALRGTAGRAGSRSRRTGPGPRARRAARRGRARRSSTSTASARRIAALRSGTGHDRLDHLTRQGVTDEDDLAVVAGHAVPAVRDGADLEPQPRPGHDGPGSERPGLGRERGTPPTTTASWTSAVGSPRARRRRRPTRAGPPAPRWRRAARARRTP